MKYHISVCLICCLASLFNYSQSERISGPVISEFGPTFQVNNPEIITNTSSELKVIFDVSQSSKDRSEINKSIETAARFLNMHVNAGMKTDQLKVAMTIHGGAWQDILTDEAYKKKFGVINPNTALVNALVKAGADIIICGQTAGARELTKNEINPNVKMALSAMTALLQYQNNGYQFIKF